MSDSSNRRLNGFTALGLAGLMALAGASLGCEQDAGDEMQDAAEETGEAVDQTTDDAGDTVDDMTE
ncbi:MAG: hypothetical protein WD316_00325 [Phycisphaeraceae bacterium]